MVIWNSEKLFGYIFNEACLEIVFGRLCITVCGRFAAKWGIQFVGMNIPTGDGSGEWGMKLCGTELT